MAKTRHDPASVDAYIAGFAAPVRDRLIELRAVFDAALPDAEQFISYRIPTFRTPELRLYFAGYDSHVAVYPVHDVPAELEAQTAPLRSGAATLRFPLTERIDAAFLGAIISSQIAAQARDGSLPERPPA